MDTTCLVSTVQAGGGVMGWEIFFLAQFGPFNANQSWFDAKASLKYRCWPSISTYCHSYHLLMSTSSRIMLHVTKQKSSQSGLNMTMSSGYFSGFPSHQNGFCGRMNKQVNVHLTDMQKWHDAIMSTWSRILKESFQHLVESITWRTEAVVRAEGGPTLY